MYYKLSEEENLRKVPESLFIFLTTRAEVEKYVEIVQSDPSDKYIYRCNIEISNLFDPELQLINTKPMIKIKLKEPLIKLKKFKSQTILVLEHKERNDCKIFHWRVKLIASDSDIDKAFISAKQSIIKNQKLC